MTSLEWETTTAPIVVSRDNYSKRSGLGTRAGSCSTTAWMEADAFCASDVDAKQASRKF